MRILIAEDSALFREGLAWLLTEAGHQVVAAVADADSLIPAVTQHQPDLAIIDVRMPPTMTNDGARAARQLRTDHPHLPIMLLSQHIESRQSVALTDERDNLLERLDAITTELGHERAITATLRRLATELSLELQQARDELTASTNVTRLPTRGSPVIGPCS